ncbi:GNAT family N-acetyltransferase [Micropruina sp.]|uniref:GNAT family N-acetyltransferase n=1 Tax=Micropruina sp. TaxID=2737536 RepID=UPI0039E6AF90
MSRIRVRDYTEADAAPTLKVFRDAVMITGSLRYTTEQIVAWAGPAEEDRPGWHARRASTATIVAVVDDQVVGFSDVDSKGYIDMLFVAPESGRRGVASRLVDEIEARARAAGLGALTVSASLLLRPLLERRGFVVEAQLAPEIGSVTLVSFAMRKTL